MTKNSKKENPKQKDYKEDVAKAIHNAKPLFNDIGYQLGGQNGAIATGLLTDAISFALNHDPTELISSISSLIAGEKDPTQQMLKDIDEKLNAIKAELHDFGKYAYEKDFSKAILDINGGLATFNNDITDMQYNGGRNPYLGFNDGDMKDIRTDMSLLNDEVNGFFGDNAKFSFMCKGVFNDAVYEQELLTAAYNVANYFQNANKAFLNACRLGFLLQIFNPSDTFLGEVKKSFDKYKTGVTKNFGCLADLGAHLLTDANFVPAFQLSTNEDGGKVLWVDSTDNNYLRFIDSSTYNAHIKDYVENFQSYFYYDQGNLMGAASSVPEDEDFVAVQYSWVLPDNYERVNDHHHFNVGPICNVNKSYNQYSDYLNNIIVENIANTIAFDNIPAIVVSVRDSQNSQVLTYNSTLDFATVEPTTYIDGAGYDNQGGPQGNEVFCLTFNLKQSKD